MAGDFPRCAECGGEGWVPVHDWIADYATAVVFIDHALETGQRVGDEVGAMRHAITRAADHLTIPDTLTSCISGLHDPDDEAEAATDWQAPFAAVRAQLVDLIETSRSCDPEAADYQMSNHQAAAFTLTVSTMTYARSTARRTPVQWRNRAAAMA